MARVSRQGYRAFFRSTQGGIVSLIISLACSSCASQEKPPLSAIAQAEEDTPNEKKGSLLEQAHGALKKGKYKRAIVLADQALAKKLPGADLLLAELYLQMGQYGELEGLLGESKQPEAVLLRARALRHLGRLDAAIALLDPSTKEKKDLLITWKQQLLLGEILVEQGKRQEAHPILAALVTKMKSGAFSKESPEVQAHGWALAGRGAWQLRHFEDANRAFNESEKLATATLSLLLWRGELFAEKFDFAHAGEVLREATLLSPHNPDLLLFTARYQMARALSFDLAEGLAERVLLINPQSTEARSLLAGISLRDLNISTAEEQIQAGLLVNSRDLRLLSLRATARFLAEDPVGFEESVARVLELSPGYSEVFSVVGEFAEWEHRYPDVEKLMRRASRLDRESGKVRALLGLTLVRAGSDAAGVVELQRSFELDPFNVRVFNTLDLYETIIPRDYVTQREGPFRFRYPRAEAKLLARYLPALLKKAHAQMVARYGYTPQAPIDIEIYADKEHFAVRTSGLPRTAIQGVCFGRKLATVSPLGSPGNLGMTLWHELGHVFHIGLSKNRVPRWFTEGLAEWETAQRGVGWSRELDLNLFRTQRAGRLPGLGRMSLAFTRARRMEDVATAYYASGKIVDWIMATRGEEAAVSILKGLGAKSLPASVVPEVLRGNFPDLNDEFQQWLKTDLSRFATTFVSREERRSVSECRALLKKSPKNLEHRFSLALALLQSGQLKEAEKSLTLIVKEAPLRSGKSSERADNDSVSLQATFALARIALAREKKAKASALLSAALSSGYEGFELRMMQARILLAMKQEKEAELQLVAAMHLDEQAPEAWGLLAALRHRRGDGEGELEALRHLAHLEEHDPASHQRLVALLIERKHYEEAAQAGALALWVDLAGVETHRLAALAFSRAGKIKRAKFEWETALLCPASERESQRLQESWEAELKRRGLHAEARQVKKEIASSRAELP